MLYRPAVSICITTKNRPELLEQTLNSISSQQFEDWELCLHDNAKGEDLGMAGGFAAALAKARGEYVLMLSDDDLLMPDSLLTLIRLADKFPGYGAYFGGCDMLHEHPAIAEMMLHRVGNNSVLGPGRYESVQQFFGPEFPQKFFAGDLGMYLFWSAGIVRREIALKVGAFPDYGTSLMGDFIYTVGCCSHQGAVITNKATVAQRVHLLNHGRAGECVDLLTVNREFEFEMCSALVGASVTGEKFFDLGKFGEYLPALRRFKENWIVDHSLFLRQYFRHFKLPNNLDAIQRKIFTVRMWIRHVEARIALDAMQFQKRMISKVR